MRKLRFKFWLSMRLPRRIRILLGIKHPLNYVGAMVADSWASASYATRELADAFAKFNNEYAKAQEYAVIHGWDGQTPNGFLEEG